MMRNVAIVRFIPTIDCFGHINLKNLGTITNCSNCVKISWENKSCVLWCVESHSVDEYIGMNSAFAGRLGIDEGTAVCIIPISCPPSLPVVTIHPDTEEDMEILESNALQIQECLLNQMRVLEKNQKMIIWVSPSLFINVTSSDTCTIHQQTEVVISFQNKERRCLPEKSKEHEQESGELRESKSHDLNNCMTNVNLVLSKYVNNIQKKKFGKMFAVNKLSNQSYKSLFKTNQLFEVFIGDSFDIENGVYSFECMESILDVQDKTNVFASKDIFVNVKTIKLPSLKEFQIMDKYVPIVVTKALSDILNVGTNKKVVLEKVSNQTLTPDVIEISPIFKENPGSVDDLLNDFKLFITNLYSKENPLLINNNFIINLTPYKNVSCQISLHPSNIKFVQLYGEMFRHCKVSVNSEPVQPYDIVSQDDIVFDMDDLCRTVENFETIVGDCVNILKYTITKESSEPSLMNKNHIFITGPCGSGKTSLCHSIVSDLGVWFTRLECHSIKGRKDILEQFQKVLQMCEDHNPSVLICDDIETIIPQQTGELSHQDVSYYEILVHSIRDLLKNCTGVYVLITATSLEDLHEKFHVTKGELLVPFHFTIPDLSQKERTQLLKHIVTNSLYNSQHVKEHNFDLMSIETEGYTIRDLKDYVTKRLFDAVKYAVYNRSREIKLQEIDDVNRNKNKSYNENDIWKSIGGMIHIKQSLIEILCWPLKYPVLFAKQPGGVLLFGPPGVGKSLIGSCIAKLSQLSFICVKGPELLSKYIGQSEQAVRNLFEKAERKKPCILFFDEFDSLAPRRGHDSTGVTDRVVNQLLTQLDGVEGSVKGVTVLAATSRPDLLDGALLRPGRFDTTINCGMPDEADRLEILKVLSEGLKLSDDVDLSELAEMTEGFSGADIKSVLSTAQLQCLEEKIEEMSISEDNAAGGEAIVTRDHLLDSLAQTRPSLTPTQLQFYDIIYSRFLSKSLTDEEKSIQDALFTRQRATLA